MATEFLPIVYREFYDIPRIFVISAGDERLLLDCQFDRVRDEYPSDFQIYRMPTGFSPPAGSWGRIVSEAVEHLGAIPVGSLQFDASGRKAVRAEEFVGMLRNLR